MVRRISTDQQVSHRRTTLGVFGLRSIPAGSNSPQPPRHSGNDRLCNFCRIIFRQSRDFAIDGSFRCAAQFIKDRGYDFFSDARAVRCLDEIPSCNSLHYVVTVIPDCHRQAELVVANPTGIDGGLRRNHVVQWRNVLTAAWQQKDAEVLGVSVSRAQQPECDDGLKKDSPILRGGIAPAHQMKNRFDPRAPIALVLA